MKYLIIPLIIVAFSFGTIAQPASDAVFEKIIKEYILNDDGSIDFRSYKKLKLLTPYSFNRLYGETFIVYNPLHQTLKINQSIVTQKDGDVVNAPSNAFNEVLPQFAADAPYYNHLREMVVTHAGLELEAVIELDYTIHSDSAYLPALMGDEILTESSPVTEEIIIIKVPQWYDLYYKVLNLRTAPEITKAGGFTEYRFTFRGIKENTHESNQPQNNSHLPRLFFSTFSAAAGQHFLADQPALNYKADQSMKEVVNRVKEETKNDLSLILKLQEIVTNNMNTYSIPAEFTGFTARNPIETWRSNGGTSFEKSLVLVTLLREAGINAEPLIIIPTAVFNDTIGSLTLISEYLVQANPRELEQIILSPVKSDDQNLIYSLSGKSTFVLNPDKPYITHVKEKYENKVITNGAFILTDSMKLSGNAELLMFEKTNPYYKIKNDSSAVKQFFGGGLSVREIKSFKVVNSSQVRTNVKYEFNQKQPVKNQANYYFCNLPLCKSGSENWHINYLNTERNTPVEIPYPVDEQYSIIYKIPDNIKLVNPLDSIGLKNNFGEMTLSITQNGNVIIVKRTLRITEQIIPVAEYKAFKQMMDLWNESKYRELVLKK
jgi:hypothetical protein